MKKLLEILEIDSFSLYSVKTEDLIDYLDILKESFNDDPESQEIEEQIVAFVDELEMRGVL